MTEDSKRIVEINGVKVEIDLRTAKRVDSFKVGDPIKVLVKSYSNSFNSYPGMIIGFDEFKERPTILICYLKYGASLEFAYLNKDSTDIEICAANEHDLSIEKADVVGRMDDEIFKKNHEIKELEKKKQYFLDHFSKAFEFKA